MGDKNIARIVTIGINPAEKEKLKKALGALGDRISNIEELNSIQKNELSEIVRETHEELSKENSNGMKVRGLLSSVMSAIEKIAALKDVCELLLPLLPAVGIHYGG